MGKGTDEMNKQTAYDIRSNAASISAERKLNEIKNLPSGWRYGRGVIFDERIIQIAIKLNNCAAENFLFETDVFPAEGGELMLTVYHGDYCIEFFIECDETINVVVEKDDKEIDSKEGLSLAQADKEIYKFRKLVWGEA